MCNHFVLEPPYLKHSTVARLIQKNWRPQSFGLATPLDS